MIWKSGLLFILVVVLFCVGCGEKRINKACDISEMRVGEFAWTSRITMGLGQIDEQDNIWLNTGYRVFPSTDATDDLDRLLKIIRRKDGYHLQLNKKNVNTLGDGIIWRFGTNNSKFVWYKFTKDIRRNFEIAEEVAGYQCPRDNKWVIAKIKD